MAAELTLDLSKGKKAAPQAVKAVAGYEQQLREKAAIAAFEASAGYKLPFLERVKESKEGEAFKLQFLESPFRERKAIFRERLSAVMADDAKDCERLPEEPEEPRKIKVSKKTTEDPPEDPPEEPPEDPDPEEPPNQRFKKEKVVVHEWLTEEKMKHLFGSFYNEEAALEFMNNAPMRVCPNVGGYNLH